MDNTLRRDERILIIDEQPLSQSFLRYALEQLNYQNITVAEKAPLALNLLRTNSYDLVICSYNQQQGKDGYQLYQEMKQLQLQKLSCGVIFISAETDPSLVHSVIELQPDEFLAKPFVIRDVQLRIERVLKRKAQLRNLYQALDDKAHQRALQEIEQLLADSQQQKHVGLLLKIKGDVLLDMADMAQALPFFKSMLTIQPLSWVRIGLVKCYLQLGQDAEAFKELQLLLERSDGRLFALEGLADLAAKQQQFQQAQQHLTAATELAPRNLLRQQKLQQLSRINHDYELQYRAARDMVKFSRYSIFEQADLYLNLARASIDFALSSEDDEQLNRLNKQISLCLNTLQRQFAKAPIAEQQAVLQARLLYLQDHKEKAQAMLSELAEQHAIASVEDALDKAKALHEVGLSEASKRLFQQIHQHCLQQATDPLLSTYLQQEQQERQAMRQGPRELNNSAVSLYKHGNWQEAFDAFMLARQVMPKNVGIALNLWQTLLLSPRPLCSNTKKQQLLAECQQLLEAKPLKPDQQHRFELLKQKFLSQLA
ncbi:response regulator [Arsukibacterium sp.]|uniref:response regulator n=1 Tax=Arsukibacterium sp. TaxID=1977258 RepID=UPI002FD9EB9C